jgi:hypothetical protein
MTVGKMIELLGSKAGRDYTGSKMFCFNQSSIVGTAAYGMHGPSKVQTSVAEEDA